jgi:predicted phage terminase large subunit-like protein
VVQLRPADPPRARRRVIVTHSRWHEDDLIGRILADETAPQWTRLRLPALAEAGDPLGRPVGAALWPERFDEAALAAIQARSAYAFASLYQQHPQPRHAGMFPPERVAILPAEPAGIKWLRWWDFGGTANGGDPTAGARVGLHAGRIVIADVASVQLEAAERDRFIRQTATLDGKAVTQWGEQEPGSGGKAQAQAFVRLLAGWPVFTEPTRGDKATAMDPLAAQWQAGNVDLVAGPWNRRFLEQAAAAPFGRHEDMIEAASRAYTKLTAPARGVARPYVSTASVSLR